MRRKLGVVAALLPGPDLLVLDEPTTGVDPVSRADLWWLITRAAAAGAAVLMSTTYLDEAARAAHVLVLDAGRPLSAGTPAEITAAVPGTIEVVPGRARGTGRAPPRLAARRDLAGLAAGRPPPPPGSCRPTCKTRCAWPRSGLNCTPPNWRRPNWRRPNGRRPAGDRTAR